MSQTRKDITTLVNISSKLAHTNTHTQIYGWKKADSHHQMRISFKPNANHTLPILFLAL